MKQKSHYCIPFVLLALFWFFPAVAGAETTTILDRMPGYVTGVGTYFYVDESEKYDVVVESTVPVTLTVYSLPDTVLLLTDTVEESATLFTVRNLDPHRTYYVYEDDFESVNQVTTDEHGVYSFVQDLNEPHAVFIREAPSTLFLRDNATGGDCPEIGVWDGATKTCAFTKDTSVVIQFASDGITLDGQGNTYTGWSVHGSRRSNVTVKNMRFVNNSGFPIFFAQTLDSHFENLTIENERYSILISGRSRRNTIADSSITLTDLGTGIHLNNAFDTTVTGNVIRSDVRGIYLTSSHRNEVTENIIIPDGEEQNLEDINRGGIRVLDSRDNQFYGNSVYNYVIPVFAGGRDADTNLFHLPLPVGGNYWSNFDTLEEGCVDANDDQFCDSPFVFEGGQDAYPRVTGEVAGTTSGPPVVAFLPGLQGSRLYTDGSVFENKLWEPNRNADVEALFLDEQGQSLGDNVYARDIIDEAFGYNAYKNFSSFMDGLVADEVIAEWRPVPYDWRFGVEHHVPAVIEELELLAADNQRITVIAHSNGGLLAKSVLQELERQKTEGESDLIDQVERLILVASPQLGTPKAVASMLHGYDLSYAKGLVLRADTARSLAEHMASAFPLLPAGGYFDEVLDPVVEFDSSADRFVPFSTLFGESVDSLGELQEFLTGSNGFWGEPAADDTVSLNVLKEHFLDDAGEKHRTWKEWDPPDHVDVIQIAGWGLDTVRSVRYEAKKKRSCSGISTAFCRNGYVLDYRPVFTADGDRTVVVPSAVATGGGKYYVNLKEHNEELLLNLRRNRNHSDILEVEPLQQFIGSFFAESEELPRHVTTTKPESTAEDKRLRVSVHSPVTIAVEDAAGNRTGRVVQPDPISDLVTIQEDIPNSYYLEFGEGKYVGFGVDEEHTITLEGTAPGLFTLEIDEIAGEVTVASRQYADMPVMSGARVELTLQTIEDASDLHIDLDGDGSVDVVVNPGEQLTADQLLDLFSVMVSALDLKRGDHVSIQAHIRNTQRMIGRDNLKLVASQLKNVEKKISKAVGRAISQEEAEAVIEVIDLIKVRLGV